MPEKCSTYDPAEGLGTDESISAFMAEACQTNDVSSTSHALGVVARAKGMAQIAQKTACHASSYTAPLARAEIRP